MSNYVKRQIPKFVIPKKGNWQSLKEPYLMGYHQFLKESVWIYQNLKPPPKGAANIWTKGTTND